ncbi:MAG: HAMP domain-containing histidine kinase [Cyclobacteriaceae bacterium]|nr:HAMP domain-containing histidine kinase [Cyclobacteriaceae bacterium]MCH8517584.1 HAMP domain-containing histidine kinase [Cyclobacteriaceae bacterium]
MLAIGQEINADSRETTIDQLIQESIDILHINTFESLQKSEEAIRLSQEISDDKREAKARLENGHGHYVTAQYNRALEQYYASLSYFEQINDSIFISKAWNGVGLIKLAVEDFEAAIAVHQKGLKFIVSHQENRSYSAHLFNTGLNYAFWKKYDSAFHYLNQAYSSAKRHQHNDLGFMIQNRLAETYLETNENEKAFELFSKIENASEAPKWEICFALAGLGKYYLKRGEYELAEVKAQQSYLVAKEMGAKWDQMKALETMITINKAKNNYLAALEKTEQYIALKDSIYDEKKQKEINFLKLQRSDAEKAALAQKNELTQTRADKNRAINLLLGGILAVVILSFAIFWYNQNQKLLLNKKLKLKNEQLERRTYIIEQQKKELKQSNENKNLLFSLIGHDLKAPVGRLSKILEFVNRGFISEKEQQEMMQDLGGQVSAVSLLLNNMLHWAYQQMDKMESRPETFSLTKEVDEIIHLFSPEMKAKDISCEHIHNTIHLPFADVQQSHIIIQNIIHNAIKFSPKNAKITISYKNEKEFITLIISDEALGMSSDQVKNILEGKSAMQSTRGTANESGTGLGLQLIYDFIHANHGKLSIDSMEGQGTTFYVSFPTKNGNATKSN